MKLWLDDERPAPEGWYWVRTAPAAIACLLDQEDDPITHMSLDHDLADVHYGYWQIGHANSGTIPRDDPRRVRAREESAKELTGYDVLLWMAEREVWPTEACYVHTFNAAAQKKMCGIIDRYGPYDQPVRWTPYQAKSEGP